MLRFVADEDFTRAIVRGVLRTRSDIEIVRVQDVGLRTQDDAIVLNWAATEGRILINARRTNRASARVRTSTTASTAGRICCPAGGGEGSDDSGPDFAGGMP